MIDMGRYIGYTSFLGAKLESIGIDVKSNNVFPIVKESYNYRGENPPWNIELNHTTLGMLVIGITGFDVYERYCKTLDVYSFNKRIVVYQKGYINSTTLVLHSNNFLNFTFSAKAELLGFAYYSNIGRE